MEEIKPKTKYFLFSSQNETNVNVDNECDGYSSRNINLDLSPYLELLGTPIYKFYDGPYQTAFGYLYGN
jgi:hypothetical protein